MSKNNKDARPEARTAKGFRDIEAAELQGLNEMLQIIRGVYERYGFEALETPALEYTDALGKFLPDQDRPNAGVFSLQDQDEQWMSLRYDLTAPLARYVAQNFDRLPKPFRRYAYGTVYRNEKPGPGRYRQFMQFDADTVGSDSVAADAEICMLAADTLEALGIKRGDYVIKVNNRKLLDGLMEANGLSGPESAQRRLIVLRAIDKIDRLGSEGVSQLLGKGRKDESGDFTPGAMLEEKAIINILRFVGWDKDEGGGGQAGSIERAKLKVASFDQAISGSAVFQEGIDELAEMKRLCEAAGYGNDRVRVDPSCIRGLEYYTGPVFEAELTFEVKGDDGLPVRFGSVGGGGRYDDLVARFTGQKVPATGFSIGVSRLQAALAHVAGKKEAPLGPVVGIVE